MRIAFLGDIALHGAFGLNHGSYRPPAALTRLGERLHPYDWVVGNLETPLTDGGRPFGAKSAHLRARPMDVTVLEALRVDAVSVSNNHTFDYGEEGFQDTVNALTSAGILCFGYDGVTAKLETGSEIVELHGFCCYSSNPVGLDPSRGPARLNELSFREMQQAVASSRSSGRFPIVSVHWGDEHVHLPRWDHIELARRVAQAVGPYVLHGHHPHVLQGIEEWEGTLLAYSLGNLCFDAVRVPGMKKPLVSPSPASRDTGFLEIMVDGGAVKRWRFHPLRFDGEAYRSVPEIGQKLLEYSAALPASADERMAYEALRESALANQVARRRQERSLEWLVYRLRLRTVLNRLEARKNRRRYLELIRRPLAEHEVTRP